MVGHEEEFMESEVRGIRSYVLPSLHCFGAAEAIRSEFESLGEAHRQFFQPRPLLAWRGKNTMVGTDIRHRFFSTLFRCIVAFTTLVAFYSMYLQNLQMRLTVAQSRPFLVCSEIQEIRSYAGALSDQARAMIQYCN
jgi:hypothetical protein